MSKTSPTIIYYSPNVTFPHIPWTMETDLPRDRVPQLCEQLHAIASERNGGSFYYPDIDNDIVRCRYEWHRPWRRRKAISRKDLTMLEWARSDDPAGM